MLNISSDFGTVHCWSMCHCLKSWKIHWNSLFLGFKVIDVGTTGTLVSSVKMSVIDLLINIINPETETKTETYAVHKQQVCVYLQPFLC